MAISSDGEIRQMLMRHAGISCPKCGCSTVMPIEKHPHFSKIKVDLAHGQTTYLESDCEKHCAALAVVDEQELFDEIHGVMDRLDFEGQGRVGRAAEIAHKLAESLKGRRIGP